MAGTKRAGRAQKRVRHRIRAAGLTAAVLVAQLALGGGGAVAQAAASGGHGGVNVAAPTRDKPASVQLVTPHAVAPKAMAKAPAPATAWPAAGSAEARLAAPAFGNQNANTHFAVAEAPMAQAGALPVWVGSAAPGGAAPDAQVRLYSRDAATAAGVPGLLLSVARSDGAAAAKTTAAATTATVPARVAVDYTGFADAYGGGWSNRLKLVAMPDCALTTPQLPACRTTTPLASVDDTAAHRVTASVPLAAGAQVLALTSTSSDSGGTYTATSLQTTGSWTAGGSSGAFDYSYPMAVPNVPGGLSPAVSLSYDSQSVDGRTSATNSQASWAGDGWDYSPGFIERSFASCADNPAGATKTGDTCWSANDTYTMSLGGRSTQLVDDPVKGWHGQDDAGDRVQLLTGAVNGDHAGQYWVVTEPSGTQYYFGQNRLKGWAGSDATTASTFTEPVYFPSTPPDSDPDAACYNATFSSSWCTLAYRWSLDYVVDTHKDAIAYFYNQETNHYSPDNGSKATAGSLYTRAGTLTKALYGFRDGQVYSASPQPAAEVLFGENGRCDTAATGCATSTLSSTTAGNWPDVPFDQQCASDTACSTISPTFWTENELTSVQTKILVGTGYQNVDLWQPEYAFPATGDSTPRALWLSSITHTGQDTLGGLPGGATPTAPPLPPTVFTGLRLANRVHVTDGYEPITRYRMTGVTSESGAVVSVDYQGASCTGGTPAVDANTTLCYPQYWTPPLASTPILDWFNKYVVHDVSTTDPAGGAQPLYVQYAYGNGAWHFDDNPLTQAKYRTWDMWRGTATVTADTGQASDSSPISETVAGYMQGMDQDPNSSGGKTSASVKDSRGEVVTDSDWLVGQQREKIVRNGVNGPAISDDITDMWAQRTASQSRPGTGLDAVVAYQVAMAATRGYAPTSTGGTRATESDYTYDGYGRVTAVSSLGDTSTGADDSCTRTAYAQDTSRWLLDLPSRVSTLNVACTATPSYPANLVTDTQNLYDLSATVGTANGSGDITTSQKADTVAASGVPHYATQATTTVDEYGRPTSSTDGLGRVTTTSYTPATGAAPTSVTTTAPTPAGQTSAFTTTKTYDPARGLQLTATDAAGHKGYQTYDPLGRLTASWAAQTNATPTTTLPNAKFTYQVSNGTTPSVVTTSLLNDAGTGYQASETLYDSLMRQRETQSPTPDGNRVVADTTYDSHGRKLLTTDGYYATGAVGPALVKAAQGTILTQNGFAYDGADRQLKDITYYAASEKWENDTTYNGVDETTSTPPGGAGGDTAASTYTDALGHTVKVVQYNGSSSTDPVATTTSYGYTRDGKTASVADTSGDTWTYGYNLLGEQVSQSDPDTAGSTFTYDAAGQQITATDARGKQVTTAYDALGRKTATYDTTGGATPAAGNKTASWTYDTLAKGYPTSSTTYDNGSAYISTVLGYTTLGQSKGTAVVIPAAEGKLAGTYVQQFTYTAAGRNATTTDSADGGLPAETISTQYDALGQPYSLTGTNTTYVADLTTDQFGKPSIFTFGASSNSAYLDLTYDPMTGRLATAATVATINSSSRTVDDTTYGYNQATGNVTSVSDLQNETGVQVTDTQCFGYDGLQRLTAAWTATDRCAATPKAGSSATVGGPNPYWQTFGYDALGDRVSEVDHNTAGVTAEDVSTGYAYPAAGAGATRPNALSSTTTTGPTGSVSAQFGYDQAGDTVSITDPVHGDHTLAWSDSGKLQSDTTAGGTSGYVYDADGNLLIRHDPGTGTLFLGDEQITGTSTAVSQAVRYYSIGGQTVAARTATAGGATQDVQYLMPDRQGTDVLALDSVTQAVTRREFTPYGGGRGPAPAAWPGGDRGYVGGAPDPTTGIETLGARQYDPVTGRFLSTDPILEANDPSQMGGYSYAADNPVTDSDPTGKRVEDPGTGCNGDAATVQQCIAGMPRMQKSSTDTHTPGTTTTDHGGSTNGGSDGASDPGSCSNQSCYLDYVNPSYAAAESAARAAMLSAEAAADLAREQAAAAAAAAAAKAKHHCGLNPFSWGTCLSDVAGASAGAVSTASRDVLNPDCPSGAGHITCENQNWDFEGSGAWFKKEFLSRDGWEGHGEWFEGVSAKFGFTSVVAYAGAMAGVETGEGDLGPAGIGAAASYASTATAGMAALSFALAGKPEETNKALGSFAIGVGGGPAGGIAIVVQRFGIPEVVGEAGESVVHLAWHLIP